MRGFHFLIGIAAFLVLLITSCNSKSPNRESQDLQGFELFYQSDQFAILEKKGQFLLEVKQTYKGSSKKDQYLLYPKDEAHDSLEGITHYVPYPITSIAISSATHLGYLEALGMSDQIDAATNLSLFYSDNFQRRIKDQEVVSIGASQFDEEKLIQLDPDVSFTYALNEGAYNKIEDLRKSGNTMIIINEYLESDPIDKAAWLRFFACFFGGDKLNRSVSYLNSIEEQYNSIKGLMRNAKDRPKVMMGFPWKGTWFVSGGDSYQAIFFRDAGADYIWKDHREEGSIPLDLEVVLSEALDAEIWINPGNKLSVDQILENDNRFSEFPVVSNKMIYSNYKRSNDSGANDYWEKGVVRPDLLLKDLAVIFHPELIKDHELFFYQNLKDFENE